MVKKTAKLFSGEVQVIYLISLSKTRAMNGQKSLITIIDVKEIVGKTIVMFAFMRFYLRILADLNGIIRRRKRNVILTTVTGKQAHQIDKVKKIDVYLNFLELE